MDITNYKKILGYMYSYKPIFERKNSPNGTACIEGTRNGTEESIKVVSGNGGEIKTYPSSNLTKILYVNADIKL